MSDNDSNFGEIKIAFDNVYKKDVDNIPWTRREWLDDSKLPIFNYIQNQNLRPQSLLDYGTGTGHLAIAIKEQFDIPKIVAADITNNCIDREQLKYFGIDFIQALQPKDVSGKYDIILCWAVFHYLTKNQSIDFLTQFSKMLNKNGTLILSAWSSHDETFKGKCERISLNINLPMYSDRIPQDKKVLNRLGFNIVTKGNLVHNANGYKRLLHFCFLKQTNN